MAITDKLTEEVPDGTAAEDHDENDDGDEGDEGVPEAVGTGGVWINVVSPRSIYSSAICLQLRLRRRKRRRNQRRKSLY